MNEKLVFRIKLRRRVASFPSLPIELVRYIMELAATEHRPTAFNLTLVSKSIHKWIMPILYYSVILPTSDQLSSFHLALQTATPRLASHVKNLFIRSMSDATLLRALDILSTCTHVERIVVDSLYRREQPVDTTLPWPAPWEVVFEYGARSWLLKRHPMLRNVTHIHLDSVLFDSTLDACIELPRLTHLGLTHRIFNSNLVSNDNFVRLTHRAVSTGRSLEMVLIHLFHFHDELEPNARHGGHIMSELAKIEDERLLVRPTLGDEDYKALLDTGTAIWDDARLKFWDWRRSGWQDAMSTNISNTLGSP